MRRLRPHLARRAAASVVAWMAVTIAACERVVSITLPTAESRLVVEARLERRQDAPADGRQTVRLTTTDAYFADREPPPARGARVRVREAEGRTVTLVERAAEPGVYATNELPVALGRPYTLEIDWEGERYEAQETALVAPPIDGLFLAPRTGQRGPREGARATVAFRDPPSERNYYLWDQYVAGVRIVAPDSTLRTRAVSSDVLFDGLRVAGFQPYDGVAVPPDAAVVVQQIAIPEAAYRYYLALSEQTGNDGSPFGVPAASVRGNVANRTRPARRALGYFLVVDVATARLSGRP